MWAVCRWRVFVMCVSCRCGNVLACGAGGVGALRAWHAGFVRKRVRGVYVKSGTRAAARGVDFLESVTLQSRTRHTPFEMSLHELAEGKDTKRTSCQL